MDRCESHHEQSFSAVSGPFTASHALDLEHPTLRLLHLRPIRDPAMPTLANQSIIALLLPVAAALAAASPGFANLVRDGDFGDRPFSSPAD